MREKRTKMMAEMGVAVALSAVANFLPLWKMPQGGSVSLEMLPILIIAFRWGGVSGLITGLIYGLVQLIFNPYILHPLQVILDYPLPYMLVGLAGFLPVKKYKGDNKYYVYLFLGLLLSGAGRFVCHVLSGVIFFSEYAPEGQNVWLYSSIYNGSFILATLVVCYIILIPLLNRLLDVNKK